MTLLDRAWRVQRRLDAKLATIAERLDQADDHEIMPLLMLGVGTAFVGYGLTAAYLGSTNDVIGPAFSGGSGLVFGLLFHARQRITWQSSGEKLEETVNVQTGDEL